MSLEARPADITIAREKGEMIIKWGDGTEDPLRWLRANCPYATCREAHRQAAATTDMLNRICLRNQAPRFLEQS